MAKCNVPRFAPRIFNNDYKSVSEVPASTQCHQQAVKSLYQLDKCLYHLFSFINN